MDTDKSTDPDQSIEMQTALKRFEDVCHSLDDEQTKLLALERRRQKLNDDLERLRNEIKEEKKYFRSVIDRRLDGDLGNNDLRCENDELRELAEPLTVDTGAINEFIANQRDFLTSYGTGEAKNSMKRDSVRPADGHTAEEIHLDLENDP